MCLIWFNFKMVNICSNIPESPAYGVYISKLKRYASACSSYGDFTDRGRLVDQGYTLEKLKIYFRNFYGRYNDLLQQYNTSLSQFVCDLVLLWCVFTYTGFDLIGYDWLYS